jgi:Kef-type K+ transport system membrane component KefB
MYFILGMSQAFSVVLAALASATAPASTMMTIRQTGAKGEFVDTLLQVVALDDVVGLLAYSIAISLALSSISGGGIKLALVINPLLINLGIFMLGGLFGLLLKLLMPKRRSTDNRLIISLAALFAFCGLCTLLDVSPLLGCMSMGTVYINLTEDEKLFKQINYFSPPILLLFFVRSGLNFNLKLLVDTSSSVGKVSMLFIGILYFVVRIAGKYAGAFAGCMIAGSSRKVRNNLGLALIPQAGVAIGLAALGARTLGGETGSALQTIILASSVLYELVGPACAKLSLHLSGSYSDKIEDIVPVSETDEMGEKKSDVELLIERIAHIQEHLPERPAVEENEAAFVEAYDEQRQAMWAANHRNKIRSRR